MNTKIFFASLLVLSAVLPSSAADRFKLTPCDQLAPTPSVELPAIELPHTQGNGRATESLVDQARKVNAMPLPLIPTAGEKQAVRQMSYDAERQQISQLWAATLDRSPDIQFVINALQPNRDPNKTRGQALKLIGGALFNAAQVAPMAFGGAPSLRIGSGAAASMLDSVWRNNTKGARPDLSPTTMAVMYSMIRSTADRLVDAYRAYKISLDAAVYAEEEADDVSRLIVSNETPTPDASLYGELSMKRAARDVKLCQNQISRHRKQLIDLAGENAVDELDAQIAEEHNALARLTGSSSWRDPLKYEPPTSASSGDKSKVPPQ